MAPTLASPKDTSANIAVPVVLTWVASFGAKSYTLQVSRSSSFSSFVFNKSEISATTQQLSDSNYLSVYYWRVSATNNAGTSQWSDVWSFTTTGEAALAPQLSLAANGAVDQKLSPVLSWGKVTNANNYSVQVSTNSSFTSFVFTSDTVKPTSLMLTGLSGLTQYYWRVSAVNNFGTKGWSETWSFTTGIAPISPILLYPSDGASDVSLPPTLTWNASSEATSYTLQVSTNSSFSSYVYNQSGLTSTSQQVSGLSNSIKYYWSVSATNSFGTSSPSTAWNFTTAAGGGSSCVGTPTVTYAGKTYHTVQIGSQCWLKENLDVGVYMASTYTGSGHSDVSNNGIIEKYCYENNEANCATYGGLYDWNEAMGYSTTPGAQGICPSGWHIPTFAEFETLKAAVSDDGNALKAVGQGSGSGAGTNTSGFSALLAGYRYVNGYFGHLGYDAVFWSSTEGGTSPARNMSLLYNDSNIFVNFGFKKDGFSIRCLKN